MAKKYKRRDKSKKKRSGPGLRARAQAMLLINQSGKWPLLGCWITADWREPGEITQIAVVRKSPLDGEIVVGGFLIDLGCLGIKDALANIYRSESEYRREYLDSFMASQPMEVCDLDLAAKVVDEAIKYARSLGFEPHSDVQYALKVLGEAHPENCDEEIPVGGEDGRPLFIAGPYDDPKRIMRILDRNVGPGNYHYVAPVGGPGFFDDLEELDDDDI